MAKKYKFPVFASLLLIFGVVWLLNDLGVVSLDVPWIPVVLIAVAIGMIVNRGNCCCQ
ncbi:MAG: hypothetical protein KKA64_00545 [Nanoarchaeota archaeon]|nr:hypothetical protein [Nanoarchaeota archaeon]